MLVIDPFGNIWASYNLHYVEPQVDQIRVVLPASPIASAARSSLGWPGGAGLAPADHASSASRQWPSNVSRPARLPRSVVVDRGLQVRQCEALTG